MLVPVRCFTCGKLIGDKFEEFKAKVEAGEDPAKALDDLRITRYCCRRMMITSVDLIDQVLPYYSTEEPRALIAEMRIQDVKVRICFNGRGDLGIEADVTVEGKLGSALSPSGASRGSNEALPFVDDSPDKTVAQFEIYKQRIVGHDAGDIDGLSQPPPRDRRHCRTTRG